MKMIDLHCHILYDIDDGAKTKEDSAALLHTAVQNEIKAIIATPHFNDYSAVDEFVAKRDERVKFLREFIGEKGLDIGLGGGLFAKRCFFGLRFVAALHKRQSLFAVRIYAASL
jgi:tyrosine-protein phosphatase YwqE